MAWCRQAASHYLSRCWSKCMLPFGTIKPQWINLFIYVHIKSSNLFLLDSRLLWEFPATGGVIPSWSFRTVKLIRYVTVSDYFVMACECIFILFILYYMVEEALEIKRHKCAYFKSVWNILDLLVITISIVCIGFNVYRSLVVGDKLDSLLENPDTFPDFEFLSYWQTVFNCAIAVTVFLAWVKVGSGISQGSLQWLSARRWQLHW